MTHASTKKNADRLKNFCMWQLNFFNSIFYFCKERLRSGFELLPIGFGGNHVTSRPSE